MQNEELKRQTDIAELEFKRANLLNILAKEHNWAEQERHYVAQQKYWKWIIIFGFLALIINGLKPLWSN